MKQIFNTQAHVGLRSVKTALTCVLCALVYLLIDRNPTFACIGVIFGTGSFVGDAKLHGGNRLIGTIIGGLIGMLLFRIYIIIHPDGKPSFILLLFLFVGVLILIFMSQLFNWPGAVQPGGVVLCILLYNTPVTEYISYSLNRIFDTGIGVIMAIIVTNLLPKDRLERFINKIFKRN